MAILRVVGFSYKIGEKPILKDVSFQMEEGEFVTVIGPNGAGKSTLLRCLDRIWTGGEGEVYVDEMKLSGYSQKEYAKIVSYVPQQESILNTCTVEEFVLMGLYPYLNPFSSVNREQWGRVDAVLARVNMSEFAERSLESLSGGERQKIMIASSLVQGARLLLLDEPTTFLDPRHQEEVYSLLRTINDESNVAVIMVTHDINHAVLVSKRILGLSEGTIIYDGDARGVMDKDILYRLYRKDFILTAHPTEDCLITVPGSFLS